MAGFLARLFGSDEIIGKAVDGVIDGADAIVFTNEERADHFLKMLKLYEPFKLAQRLLALILTIPYVLTWLVSVLLFLAGAFLPGEVGTHFLQVSKDLATMNNDALGFPVALVLGFYFGGGAIEGVAKGIAGKGKK